MTTLNPNQKQCAVCHSSCSIMVLGSTSSFGAPDLDLRPAEMARSTIGYWVQRCHRCGYCAEDVEAGTPTLLWTIDGFEYQKQLRNPDYPELANEFLCQAQLEQFQGNLQEAIWSIIHAAWACDDAGQETQAVACRLRAAEQLVTFFLNPEITQDDAEGLLAVQVDLLRRAGHFEAAQTLLAERMESVRDETIREVLEFQGTLIAKMDLKIHTLDEVKELEESTKKRKKRRRLS